MPGWEAPQKSADRKWPDKLVPVRWPEAYGFTVTSGDAPCYVTSVERGGAAHKSGICPGDQIVEVDGRNVADMSADRVRTLATLSVSGQRSTFKVTGAHRVARPTTPSPPTLGVVSRVQYVELSADMTRGYGINMAGVRPTVVTHVDPEGPAQRAGIKPGNYLLLLIFVITYTYCVWWVGGLACGV